MNDPNTALTMPFNHSSHYASRQPLGICYQKMV